MCFLQVMKVLGWEVREFITCLHLVKPGVKHMCFCDVTNGEEPKVSLGLESWEVSKKSEKNGFKVSEILGTLKIAGFLPMNGINKNTLRVKYIYCSGQFGLTASLYSLEQEEK